MISPDVERETEAEYWARKRSELRLLGSRLDGGTAPRDPESVGTVAELVAEKQALRARLLAQAVVRSPEMTESRVTPDRDFALGGGRAKYTYQRYDLAFRRKPFWDGVYSPTGRKDLLSIGLYVGSGMAAITSALMGIDRSLPPTRKLLISPHSYFETMFFVHRFPKALVPSLEPHKTPFDGNVLYIDSFVPRNMLASLIDRSFAKLAYVVCDTTCWDAGDPSIARLAARCLDDGVPLVLVRSHIKLDQLGTEYWRAGSIVMVFSRGFGTAKIRELKQLRARMHSFLTLTGGNFLPHALFPLGDDPEFVRLNRLRNRRLMRNNHEAARRLKALLRDSLTRVKEFHHGCFVGVLPILDTSGAVTENMNALAKELRAAGLEARAAASFGYDFAAITRVGPMSGSSSALRISVPDWPQEMLDTFVRVTARYAFPLSVY